MMLRWTHGDTDYSPSVPSLPRQMSQPVVGRTSGYHGRVVESNQHDHGGVHRRLTQVDQRLDPAHADGEWRPPGPDLDGGSNGDDDHGEASAVYADLNALHWVIPLFGAVLGLAVLGLLVYQTVGGSEDATADDRADEVAEVVESDTGPEDPAATAQGAVDEFAGRLSAGRLTDVAFAFETGLEAAADHAAITELLGDHGITVQATRVQTIEEVRSRSTLTVDWELADGTEFTTRGEVDVVQIGTEWLVDWSPRILEESLAPGDRLVRERLAATRMPIIGQNDVELFGQRPVIEIGVLPRRAPAIRPLADELAQLLQLDGDEVFDLISRSPSDRVLAVAQRRPETVESILPRLKSMAGVVLIETTAPLAVYDQLGRAVLGRVGPATAEIIEAEPDRFQDGDIVGRAGLQALYNDRLSGYPGYWVRIDRRFPLTDGSGSPLAADDPANVVFLSDPEPGEPIRTTIDYEIQKRAELALNLTDRPSALVAIRASTGEILAAANGPFGSPDNHALTGQYPPGSVFKIITAFGALERGANANQPIDCPAEVEVDGRRFTNADGGGGGQMPILQAFAQSCNTAFILLGETIAAEDYPGLARRFGVGVEYDLGTPAFSGSVPVPSDRVERAATSFGQSRVLVSPLSMAVMAAAVADGNYRPPLLMIDETTTVPSPPQGLDPGLIGQLTQMMQATVEWGTGQAAGRVPGGPVFGKTGTAQYGSGDQPATHAWFVGFQGDVAFAILVDGGGSGGAVAAPIAADFVTRLNT